MIAGLVACSALPAQALQIRWTAFVQVVENRFDEEGNLLPEINHGKHRLYIGGEDLNHLSAGGAPGITPMPSILIATVEENSISIGFPPLYFAPFGIWMSFDQPLKADLSNLGSTQFLSGGYYVSSCGRGSPSNCSSWSGSMTGLWLPEPSTWAMMIVGFGLVGATMRRRAVVRSTRFA